MRNKFAVACWPIVRYCQVFVRYCQVFVRYIARALLGIIPSPFLFLCIGCDNMGTKDKCTLCGNVGCKPSVTDQAPSLGRPLQPCPAACGAHYHETCLKKAPSTETGRQEAVCMHCCPEGHAKCCPCKSGPEAGSGGALVCYKWRNKLHQAAGRAKKQRAATSSVGAALDSPGVGPPAQTGPLQTVCGAAFRKDVHCLVLVELICQGTAVQQLHIACCVLGNATPHRRSGCCCLFPARISNYVTAAHKLKTPLILRTAHSCVAWPA